MSAKWTQEEIDALSASERVGINVGDVKSPRSPDAAQKDRGKAPIGSGTSSPTVTRIASDDEIERRMERLREFLTRGYKPAQYANVGAEIGRPKLKPIDQLKLDPSNVFSRPTIDNLLARGSRPESNSVMTGEQLMKIGTKLAALGVPQEELSYVMWDAAFYCKDSSASAYVDPKGTIDFSGGAIQLDSVFACIRDVCTLRQFCRYFAPITWNRMNVEAQPPSDWMAKGFTDETKYAAFDCFDYIKNRACLQPLDGLFREPTKSEVIAYQTHKKIALDRNSRNDRFANTSADITGGKFGCKVKGDWRESKCD
ncbi:MAG: coat protein [Beijing sediment betaflexivirus]|nr:MAG: coat protein [Beijing sediment betaflexivirus]